VGAQLREGVPITTDANNSREQSRDNRVDRSPSITDRVRLAGRSMVEVAAGRN